MLMIRLRRTGGKHDPHYRVVVAEKLAARDGRFVEVLGHYHPRQSAGRVVLDVERTRAWIAKGAQLSDTVRSLLKQAESGAADSVGSVSQTEPSDAVETKASEAQIPEPEAVATKAAQPKDAEPETAESEVEE